MGQSHPALVPQTRAGGYTKQQTRKASENSEPANSPEFEIMSSPNSSVLTASQFCRRCVLFVLTLSCLGFASCTRVTRGADPKTSVATVKPVPPKITTWLGNPGRNF